MIIFINFSIFSSIKRKACSKNRLNPRQMPGALFRRTAYFLPTFAILRRSPAAYGPSLHLCIFLQQISTIHPHLKIFMLFLAEADKSLKKGAIHELRVYP